MRANVAYVHQVRRLFNERDARTDQHIHHFVNVKYRLAKRLHVAVLALRAPSHQLHQSQMILAQCHICILQTFALTSESHECTGHTSLLSSS